MQLRQERFQDYPEKDKIKMFSKLVCPKCHEKDMNQFVTVGEGNIKCMSCCNFYDCYLDQV